MYQSVIHVTHGVTGKFQMNMVARQLAAEYTFTQPVKMLILIFKTASSDISLICAIAPFVVAGHLSP